jgi:hypothetical protein
MSFDQVSGSPVVRGSQSPYDKLSEQITRELAQNDDESSIKKKEIAKIALAVGLIEERRESEIFEENRAQFNLPNLIESPAMRVIIEERYPDASPNELVTILREYFEGGLQVIAEDVDMYGIFRYAEYIEMEDRNGQIPD